MVSELYFGGEGDIVSVIDGLFSIEKLFVWAIIGKDFDI